LINQWKKFNEELTDDNYLALLQLYINEQFSRKAVEVVDSMISHGINIPPSHFHQLILIGTTWRSIMSIWEKWTDKDSRLIIDKMVFKHLSNVHSQMEDGHFEKDELRAAKMRVKKSLYYYKTYSKLSPQEREERKKPRWEHLNNYILMIIALSKSELSVTQIRHGLFEKFKFDISQRRIFRELRDGPFSKSVLCKKWRIGKETYYISGTKPQNNDVQRHIEKFANNLMLKYWKYPVEKLVDRITSQWTPRNAAE
jgi:hypothetical protein